MNNQATLAIIGSGRLARAVCYSLASFGHRLRVIVLARNRDSAAEVCYTSAARAAGSPVTFEPVVVDLNARGAVAEAFSIARPDGVLVAASSQSPWEGRQRRSAWTDLVRRAGFGLTLPFQAELALQVGRALADRPTPTWMINGCFPDAVNPVLAALGIPVLCGVGNVNLIGASLRAGLGLSAERDLRVLAHHAHLHTPPPSLGEVLAWVDGEPVDRVGELLAVQRTVSRPELNHVTGHIAARLITDVLAGTSVHANLPGPLGMPGGYPVRLSVRSSVVEATLRLPATISLAEATAFNQRAARHDGVVVEDGRVLFTRVSHTDLPAELVDGFPISDLEQATRRLEEVRTRLRKNI